MRSITVWVAGATLVLTVAAGCTHGMGGHTMGSGTGMGMGQPGDADAASTPGWSMMSPEERHAHRSRMQSMGNREECMRHMEEHQRRMMDRAKEHSVAPPAPGDAKACEGMGR